MTDTETIIVAMQRAVAAGWTAALDPWACRLVLAHIADLDTALAGAVARATIAERELATLRGEP